MFNLYRRLRGRRTMGKEGSSWRGQAREVWQTFGNTPRAFRLVWECGRLEALAMATVTVLSAFLPAAQAWVAKLIVDSVVSSIRQGLSPGQGFAHVMPYLGIEFGLIFVGAVAGQLRSLAEHLLHAQLVNHVNTLIIRKALTLDLRFFEDAHFYDKLQNARREADWNAVRIVNEGFLLVQNVITLLSMAALVMRFSPWLALILFGAAVPTFIAQSRYSRLSFKVVSWWAPEARRMNYLEELLTTHESAKEMKLFSLGEPLLDRYHNLFWRYYIEDRAIAVRRTVVSLALGLFSTLSYYGSYAWILWRTLAAAITLGDMTMYIVVFRQTQSSFRSLFEGLGRFYENNLFLNNLFGYLALTPEMSAPAPGRPAPSPIRQGFEFRNVSFRYPGNEAWSLREINLSILTGEKVALVGLNGAGKTTLVKLLTRLYDPTEGQILLDGVDLKEYDVDSLRRCIGVIFQDFVQYHLAARENVGFGKIEAVEDRPRVVEASRKGGAHPVIERLAEGYETVLGRRFDTGQELSRGEWQKVALARAFMRDAEVLVLDEPTASLDAEAEYEIFRRFGELTQGKTAVLISHRFSTVRMAGRIVVLEAGRVTEVGSHAELLAKGGTYAHLFTLQAQSYR
ncbi:MAG: ABC transporter ATP-binding protein [Chloroflexi bacterium]|nr:ABC transporter ATP-binding protein [Chloroflexota bacterium]